MAWHISQLNDRILRMMSPEDRKQFGKAGMTAEEALRKARVKSERDLQNLIDGLLRLKGIEAIRSRMEKKTSNNVGTPDFLFAINGRIVIGKTPGANWHYAVAWEVKLPGGKLSEEQTKMAARMTAAPNGWRWSLITSVDEALEELRSLGIN